MVCRLDRSRTLSSRYLLAFLRAARRNIYAKNRITLLVLPQVLFLAPASAPITCPREVDVIFHTVYASSASKAFTKPDLQALLQEIRPKNANLGVTGMLLYKDGNFMQALEGEQGILTGLVRIIQHDSRHQGMLVLLRGMSDQGASSPNGPWDSATWPTNVPRRHPVTAIS